VSRFGLNLGNAPTAMHPSTVCKSSMQANFYSIYEPINDTKAWYTAHLKDLKHAHAYSSGRSRDVFYNSAGTMVVGITGQSRQGWRECGYARSHLLHIPTGFVGEDNSCDVE
jgi:hypothetical protein